jgi:hypothetical protein
MGRYAPVLAFVYEQGYISWSFMNVDLQSSDVAAET